MIKELITNKSTGWPSNFDNQFKVSGLTFSVYSSLQILEHAWRRAECEHNTTYFQTFDWCESWLSTVGHDSNITPIIVVIHTSANEFMALLPLQVRTGKFGPVLEWLTTPQLIYGYGIFSDEALTPTGLQLLDMALPSIFHHLKVSHIHLTNLPARMCHAAHPFLIHCNVRDADSTTLVNLQPDYDALLLAKRSSDSRKNIRWRDSKIAAAGKLTTEEVSDSKVLDELFSDQAARLAEAGIDDPTEGQVRSFFHKLINRAPKALSVLRVAVDNRGIASLLLAKHGDVVVDLMTSLANTDLRRYSPGDLAMRKSIELACTQGFKSFDFSIGAAAYKTQWTDQSVSLHHIVRGVTLWGYLASILVLTKLASKRIVKNNPILKSAAYNLRRLLKSKAR